MKRTIVIAILTIALILGGIALVKGQLPENGQTVTAICIAYVRVEPELGDVKVIAELKSGDTFTLTGRYESRYNGTGAHYAIWEGVTEDGILGWVKANAFYYTEE